MAQTVSPGRGGADGRLAGLTVGSASEFGMAASGLERRTRQISIKILKMKSALGTASRPDIFLIVE